MDLISFYMKGYHPYIVALQDAHFGGIRIDSDLEGLEKLLLSFTPVEAKSLFTAFRTRSLPLPNGDKTSFFKAQSALSEFSLSLSENQALALELIGRYCRQWQVEGFLEGRLELLSRRDQIESKFYLPNREQVLVELIEKKLLDEGVIHSLQLYRKNKDDHSANLLVDEFIHQRLLWSLSLRSAKDMTYEIYRSYLDGDKDEGLFREIFESGLK